MSNEYDYYKLVSNNTKYQQDLSGKVNLTMSIDLIGTLGILEVRFSHEMFTNFTNLENSSLPVNLSRYLNESNTNITIIPNYASFDDENFNIEKLALKWTPFYYKNKTLKVYL